MIDDQDRQILERIDELGYRTTDRELHYQLARRSRAPRPDLETGALLELIAELEEAGLVATALEIRLTDAGRAELDRSVPPATRTTPYPPSSPNGTHGRARPRRVLQAPAGRVGPRRAAA